MSSPQMIRMLGLAALAGEAPISEAMTSVDAAAQALISGRRFDVMGIPPRSVALETEADAILRQERAPRSADSGRSSVESVRSSSIGGVGERRIFAKEGWGSAVSPETRSSSDDGVCPEDFSCAILRP